MTVLWQKSGGLRPLAPLLWACALRVYVAHRGVPYPTRQCRQFHCICRRPCERGHQVEWAVFRRRAERGNDIVFRFLGGGSQTPRTCESALLLSCGCSSLILFFTFFVCLPIIERGETVSMGDSRDSAVRKLHFCLWGCSSFRRRCTYIFHASPREISNGLHRHMQ